MFTNKHVIVALLVAPILSVLAWYAVGALIGEQPQPAQPGRDYPLVAKSNCRYPSGLCVLENEDFSITLRLAAQRELRLESAHPLEGVMVSVEEPEPAAQPDADSLQFMAVSAMVRRDEAGLRWSLTLPEAPRAADRIRLVARANGSDYYGDAATLFAQPDTGTVPRPSR